MQNVTCHSGCQYSLTFTVELPWPSSQLSPNARGHWTRLAQAKKAYRARCRAIAGVAAPILSEALQRLPERLDVAITFVPPDRRARDLDNLLASMKSGLDGLADALGVDDSRWRLQIEMAGETTPGGIVLVDVGVPR